MPRARPLESMTVAGGSILAAMAANAVLRAGWRRTRHEEPPKDPTRLDVPWKQALLWVGLSSLATAIARVIVARSTAARMERRL